MQSPGPFHARRHEIVAELQSLLETGDIFFRRSDARFLGIPFSWLVARLTHSKFSHASVALVEGGEINLVEVNEMGCTKMRLIDWISICKGEEIAVYRLTECRAEVAERLEAEIRRLLAEDPDYDFTFTDRQAYYCTESVIEVYRGAGITLCEPKRVKEIVPRWFYYLYLPLNTVIRAVTGKGVPPDRPLYFVGNEKQGMLSSPLLTCIYRIEATKEADSAVKRSQPP